MCPLMWGWHIGWGGGGFRTKCPSFPLPSHGFSSGGKMGPVGGGVGGRLGLLLPGTQLGLFKQVSRAPTPPLPCLIQQQVLGPEKGTSPGLQAAVVEPGSLWQDRQRHLALGPGRYRQGLSSLQRFPDTTGFPDTHSLGFGARPLSLACPQSSVTASPDGPGTGRVHLVLANIAKPSWGRTG